MLLTWLVSIPLGIYSATHQYKVSDHTLTFFGFLGLSIPNFFFALVVLWMLVAVFHVGPDLGVGGLFSNKYIEAPWSWNKFLNLLWHLWPVWLVVGTSGMAGLMRYMRGSLLDTLRLPYVQTARAKGLSERVVIYKHAVRNAINPLITMLGMSLPNLLSGTLVTAIIFNLPTVERAYWQSLNAQDQYVTMGDWYSSASSSSSGTSLPISCLPGSIRASDTNENTEEHRWDLRPRRNHKPDLRNGD